MFYGIDSFSQAIDIWLGLVTCSNTSERHQEFLRQLFWHEINSRNYDYWFDNFPEGF